MTEKSWTDADGDTLVIAPAVGHHRAARQLWIEVTAGDGDGTAVYLTAEQWAEVKARGDEILA
jgi:hypothetical protein